MEMKVRVDPRLGASTQGSEKFIKTLAGKDDCETIFSALFLYFIVLQFIYKILEKID